MVTWNYCQLPHFIVRKVVLRPRLNSFAAGAAPLIPLRVLATLPTPLVGRRGGTFPPQTSSPSPVFVPQCRMQTDAVLLAESSRFIVDDAQLHDTQLIVNISTTTKLRLYSSHREYDA